MKSVEELARDAGLLNYPNLPWSALQRFRNLVRNETLDDAVAALDDAFYAPAILALKVDE